MKKAITFTICAGTSACPNKCKICISELTGKHGFDTTSVPWDVFQHAIHVAMNYHAENVLITGKGEPILYPDQVKQYLFIAKQHKDEFTRFELQTSGDGMDAATFLRNLVDWKNCGLDVVALSLYHYDDKENDDLFRPVSGHREPIASKMRAIKEAGLKLRLTFVMMKGYIDSPGEVEKCLKLASDAGAFQTTFRSLGMPEESKNPEVERFVKERLLSKTQEETIKKWFDVFGHACDKLPFGGTVYEIFGQNACLTTCLDQCNGTDELRNLIFFPDGTLATSWEHPRGTALL
jgi:MoaA/NifB/PqqE/SkfB family radical SAM enzyme